MKNIVTELTELDFDKEQRREAIESMDENATDFSIDSDGGEFRFIHTDSIDEVLKDELSSDTYMLGCFNAWFIAGITGLDCDIVEKAQKAENFELLGALMLKNIDEVVEQAVSADGYGHHFAHYDGNEYEIGEFLVFRTN